MKAAGFYVNLPAEVPVVFRLRLPAFVSMLAAVLGLGAAPGLAQDWTLGAAWGGVNNIKSTFKLDGFQARDISAWADYQMEPHVLLRGSYENISTARANAPIDAGTLAVSYTFFEGFFTSGLFGGIGGYRIRPEATATAAPPAETAFGFNAGVDGDFRITRNASLVIRLTYHGILSHTKQSLLVAGAGIAAHF
jgi:hypothetical protein